MKSVILLFFLAFCFEGSAKTYYVAPTGGSDSSPGTLAQPWASLAYSINQLNAGDTLFVRGGVYYLTSQLRFDSANDGTSGNPIVMINYPGESPIIDCNGLLHQSGIVMINVNYWTIQGLEQRYARQDGSTLECTGFNVTSCTNIHLNYLKIHDNGGYGMNLRMSDNIFVRGVDTYNNCDSTSTFPGGKGDGNGGNNYTRGADTLTWGTYYFDKCRSWNNSDDGWGLGYQVYAYIDSCWSFNNGTEEMPFEPYSAGRGFSTGHSFYEGTHLPCVILTNCVSVYNKIGYYLNCNGENYTTIQAWYNCIAAFNSEYGFNLNGNNTQPPQHNLYIKNCISYSNATTIWTDLDIIAPGKLVDEYNTWNGGVTLTTSDFVSLDTTGITSVRQANGDFPNNNCYKYFMHLASTSDLIDVGIDVGLDYAGNAPDIGAFEYPSGGSSIPSIPVNVSSVVENATPSRLEMTYNLTLANIVPCCFSLHCKC